jgi:hypothetical protein
MPWLDFEYVERKAINFCFPGQWLNPAGGSSNTTELQFRSRLWLVQI